MGQTDLSLKKNRRRKSDILFCLIVLCAVLLSAGVALNQRLDVSFMPINGDFQHYNMFRRLLAGQIPFFDFFCMLGNGVLFTNSALLALIGNTFGNSVFCTHFTVSMAGFLIVTMLVFVFVRNKVFSAAVSLCLALFTHGFNFFYTFPGLGSSSVYTGFLDAVAYLTKRLSPVYIPDNASRPLRMTILFFVLAIIILFCTRRQNPLGRWFFAQNILIRSAFCGFFAGLAMLWANDYGVSAYMGCSFILFLWLTRRWLVHEGPFKEILTGCLSYIGASLTGVFLGALCITRGHIGAWFHATFATSGNLWWYDGIMYDRKPLTLFDLPPFNGDAVIPLVFAFCLFVYLLVRFFRKKDFELFTLLHIYLLTTIFFNLYLYCLKDGYEIEYINAVTQYFVIAMCSGIYYLAKWLQKKRPQLQAVLRMAGKGLVGLTAACSIAVACFYSYSSIRHYIVNRAPNEYWVEELDGNVQNFSGDLKTTQAILEGHSLFATYASALETMEGVFHPAYSDYIIHVFGDEMRENYIEAFREFDPDYVSVISRDYTRWEAWVCNANWFFYREFLPNYRFEFRNQFARYLRKTEESNEIPANISVQVNQLDDASTEVIFTSDVTDKTLILDAQISYHSAFTPSRFRSLALNRIVSMEGDSSYLYPKENFDCWFLPNDGDQYPFPVMVENGVGRIVLKSNPGDCTRLSDVSVQVLGAYDFHLVFGEFPPF